MGKVLKVDLTSMETKTESVNEEWLDHYTGGKGLGFRYLLEEIPVGADPFSDENVFILMTGPFTGTAVPTSSRLGIFTKSPATGTILDSYVGGNLGPEIKAAGYDAILVRGSAGRPVYLYVNDDHVEIRDARPLWGKGISETEDAIRRDLDDKKLKLISIGPAGENRVKFACLASNNRQAGRGGAGAAMGSKNLKSIAVVGNKKVKIHQEDAFKNMIRDITKEDVMTDNNLWAFTDGTPLIVQVSQQRGVFPTRNFQYGVFEHADNIDAEAIKGKLKGKKACKHCPIGCGKVLEVRGLRVKVGDQVCEVEGPDYETLALGGSNCGIGDLDAVAEFNWLCDDLGLDTISTGNVIGFAMELTERGIYDFGVTFGDIDSYLSLPMEIATMKEERGKLLAKGVRQLGKELSAVNYAQEVKGLEFPGYDPRGSVGMGLGYATAERGACHMRGFALFAEAEDPFSIEGKEDIVISKQNFNAIKWSLILCDFWGSIDASLMAKVMKGAIGKEFTEEQLIKTGEKIWNLGRIFNVREGFRRKDDYLPPRILNEPLPTGPAANKVITEERWNRLLSNYYAKRGWDEEGIPLKQTIDRLGFDEPLLSEVEHLLV
jgi:aldehyde:ferredoxin oxidoreductase